LIAPLSLLPDTVCSRLAATVLNQVLSRQLKEGELDFLHHRSVTIRVRDAGISVYLTVGGQRFRVTTRRAASDLSIEASVYDFLRLVGQQDDPDTLVFQRRLVMQGDTELGLEVKNFLDGLDVDSLGLYRHLAPVLHRLLPVYQQVFG
jgi:predicted lipid carrier protein YhbT